MSQDTIPGGLAASAAGAASKVTYGGGSAAVMGWMMSSEFLSLLGVGIAVAGLLVNLWFKIREDRRQQALHDAQMRALQDGPR